MKVSFITTALSIAASALTALALPASAPGDFPDRDDVSRRNPMVGEGVNIWYEPGGLVKVFGVLRFTAAMYTSFSTSTGGSGNGAEEIAKNLYTHCLESLVNGGSGVSQFTKSAAQKALSSAPHTAFGLWDAAIDPAAPFTTGMMVHLAKALDVTNLNPAALEDFVLDLVNYFAASDVAWNFREVTLDVLNTIGPRFPASKREENHVREIQSEMKRQYHDQVCATPIDIRQYFTNDTAGNLTSTTYC